MDEHQEHDGHQHVPPPASDQVLDLSLCCQTDGWRMLGACLVESDLSHQDVTCGQASAEEDPDYVGFPKYLEVLRSVLLVGSLGERVLLGLVSLSSPRLNTASDCLTN